MAYYLHTRLHTYTATMLTVYRPTLACYTCTHSTQAHIAQAASITPALRNCHHLPHAALVSYPVPIPFRLPLGREIASRAEVGMEIGTGYEANAASPDHGYHGNQEGCISLTLHNPCSLPRCHLHHYCKHQLLSGATS